MGNRQTLKFRATLTNVGGSPAFNCRVQWEEDSKDSKDFSIIAPGQSILMTFLYGLGGPHQGTTRYIVAEYDSPIGISVKDRFEVHGHVQQMTFISGGTLAERKYTRGSGIELEIDGE